MKRVVFVEEESSSSSSEISDFWPCSRSPVGRRDTPLVATTYVEPEVNNFWRRCAEKTNRAELTLLNGRKAHGLAGRRPRGVVLR